jgi:hypothetical protein
MVTGRVFHLVLCLVQLNRSKERMKLICWRIELELEFAYRVVDPLKDCELNWSDKGLLLLCLISNDGWNALQRAKGRRVVVVVVDSEFSVIGLGRRLV